MDKVIKEYTTDKLVTIVLWDNQTLQEIYNNSGELADTCEYQVHYWSLNIQKIFEDGSILVIQIPTTIFNYKQEVAGGSIDFELKDVEEVSNALEPIQELESAKRMPLVEKNFKDFTFQSVSLNTLHRHP